MMCKKTVLPTQLKLLEIRYLLLSLATFIPHKPSLESLQLILRKKKQKNTKTKPVLLLYRCAWV